MSRPHGRARVNPGSPKAFAVCDACGMLFNHVDLRWKHDWVGPRLQNKRFLVCDRCLDVPQEQLRTIILPPDPLPIQNPRPNYGDQNAVQPGDNYFMEAAYNQFDYAGSSNSLVGNFKNLSLDSRSFQFAGTANTLGNIQQLEIYVDYRNSVLTGITNSLNRGYAFSAETKSFSLTGSGNYFSIPSQFIGTPGQFLLTGISATFRRQVNISQKDFTFTGAANSFKRAYVISAGTKAFSFSGIANTLGTSGRILSSSPGAFSASFRSAALNVNLAAGVKSFALSGIAVTFTYNYGFSADYHSYTQLIDESGNPLIDESGNPLVDESAPVDTFAFTGYSNVFNRPSGISTEAKAFSFTGIASTLTATLRGYQTPWAFTPVEIPEVIHQRRKVMGAIVSTKPSMQPETKQFSLSGLDVGLSINIDRQLRRSPARTTNPNTYWEPPEGIKT